MLCPVCAVDLVMTERNGVEIDYCPACRGVWLDRGELDKIINRSPTDDYDHVSTSSGGGKKHPYRGMHHHSHDDVYAGPKKPKRGYEHYTGGKKHPNRGMHHHDREYEYKKPYRKKSKKKRAKDLLEDIFDIFD